MLHEEALQTKGTEKMPDFKKFQRVAVSDNHNYQFEGAYYLGPSGNEEYPYTVLLECEVGFEVDDYTLCVKVDENGDPMREDIDRTLLLQRRGDLLEQERATLNEVNRQKSRLADVTDALDSIQDQLKALDAGIHPTSLTKAQKETDK